MRKLLAIIKKDGLLLLRDKIGLTILFILPMFLVLTMSLIQSNLERSTEIIDLLLIDQDGSDMGQAIHDGLHQLPYLNIIPRKASNENDITQAQQQVAQGIYSALLIIPPTMSDRIASKSQALITHQTEAPVSNADTIQVYLDPAMPTDMAQTFNIALKYTLQNVQLHLVHRLLLNLTKQPPQADRQTWFPFEQHSQTTTGALIVPNTVQQNIPAWTLFGMFFIVIPLAGQMVLERKQSVIQRIYIAPVSMMTVLVGRLITYISLNLVQLTLMLLIGIYVLPLLSLPALTIGSQLELIFLVGLFASLAATGFGLCIGAWAKTFQQATSLGPFIIVIVAAISGIFVPIYVMPDILVSISQFSPLYWAQSAFLDIFVRNVGLTALLPNLGKLLIFFLLMLTLALQRLGNKEG